MRRYGEDSSMGGGIRTIKSRFHLLTSKGSVRLRVSPFTCRDANKRMQSDLQKAAPFVDA